MNSLLSVSEFKVGILSVTTKSLAASCWAKRHYLLLGDIVIRTPLPGIDSVHPDNHSPSLTLYNAVTTPVLDPDKDITNGFCLKDTASHVTATSRTSLPGVVTLI